jgi:membrane protein
MLEPLWRLLDRLLWSPQSAGGNPLAIALRLLRYPYALLRDLDRGDINLRAMGLVYATLLSLIPLVAFVFAVLKAFDLHRDLEPIVYEAFKPVGSAATELTARVMEFADSVSGGIVGTVGFALLLWTLIGTIQKVEDSFNFLWRLDRPRSFARRMAEYASLVIVGPFLLVAFLGLAHTALDSEAMQGLADARLAGTLIDATVQLAPYAIVCAIFTGLYLFVPNTQVRFVPAAVAGLAAGVLWAAVGKLFTALVMLSSRLTIVYAGFAVVIGALLWTWLGWVILLCGARLAYYLQTPGDLRLGLTELRLSNAEFERLTLKVMYFVGDAHLRGEAGWDIDAIAHRLGVPVLAIAQAVEALERAGLLAATDQERLMPARDIGQIALTEILDVARNRRGGHAGFGGVSVPAVDELALALDASWRASCGGRTLRDLVDGTA